MFEKSLFEKRLTLWQAGLHRGLTVREKRRRGTILHSGQLP